MKDNSKRITLVLALMLLAAGSAAGAGRPSVSLNWLSHYYEFEAPAVDAEAITLAGDAHTLRFFGNSRRMEFDGITVWLSSPVRRRWGRWRVLKADLDTTIVPLLYPERFLVREGARVVVLDPGHGGRDRGVMDPWHGQEEKMLTLRLAKKVRTILQDEGITVCLTREDDEWVSLRERCERALACGADLFVSIHLNGATNLNASGVETHVLTPVGAPSTDLSLSGSVGTSESYPGNRNDAANIILGYALQSSMVRHNESVDRGVRRSRFHVIRNMPCPAVLVECGFLSNREEAEKFLDTAYCGAVARSIGEGIVSYLAAVRRSKEGRQPCFRPDKNGAQ